MSPPLPPIPLLSLAPFVALNQAIQPHMHYLGSASEEILCR